ncbi:hypothetical protein QL285_003680 [Trifolium repens]|jgi:hypothetical protein|nr:hypothetical protein QL285_063258 [Trifolium repens]KAK2389685.1 hypothetical protein QL285_063259 [Trifolium repens]KAK2456304.1 hypothetical protein QL285_003680 [Trifolium repens]
MRSDGCVLNIRSTHRIKTRNQTARIQTQGRRRYTVRLSSPVTLASPATAPVTGVHPNLHETYQTLHGFVRFFTRNSNMEIVFTDSSQKMKNDEGKV